MSVGEQSAVRGSFGIVGPDIGKTRERSLVNEGQLSEEVKESLQADTFVIYGKASVEQYDDDTPSQKIEMKAFERQLPKFLEGGIISRRHKDIPVGEPLESYTLDSDTEIVVADEVLEFEAGDTLETGVRDDELWIVADLRNDSEIARETRVGAMTGDLTGFSVTVFCKEWEETQKGQRVTDIDWHSTTIGGDEHIKNKDSRFGVADFKGQFGTSQSAGAALEILRQLPTNMSSNTQETSKGFWDRVKEVAETKAEEADGDAPEDTKEEQADQKEYDDKDKEEYDEKASDVDAVMERVKNELGEDHHDLLQKEMEAGYHEEDEEEINSEAERGELKSVDPDALAEAMETKGFVRADDVETKAEETAARLIEEKAEEFVSADSFSDRLEEKLEDKLPESGIASKEDIEHVIEAAEETVVEAAQKAHSEGARDGAEEAAEKMATGGTPDPTGGPSNDSQDYRAEIKERYGSKGSK